MTTNADYFKGALQKIGILAEGESASPEQGADMLVIFNDMLDYLRGEGIDWGAPQTVTTGTPDIPEGNREIAKCLLAVRAADHFQVPVPPSVAYIATQGQNRMLRESIYAEATPRDFDHTPFGRGRRYNIITGS